ncbi:hypothetical protein [Pedobacter sp. BMA]|uniref:hypothetical protein n=1 Tax=Pedobacter sp. BMA TaxID=1663685 RepID=UPI0006495D96|nr:hypothetical protein [Pedobacter sp. BMA]KLT67329.1 hypothetical protein AB669_01035 [Pedobacter sp. BMA]
MKFLKIILVCFFISTLVSLTGVFILQSAQIIGTADSDMKNLPYGIAIGFNLYLFLGTLSVFFNLNQNIRENSLWSALSFFLLPAIFLLLSLFAMWDEAWPGVLYGLPYFIILSICYLGFRKNMSKKIM